MSNKVMYKVHLFQRSKYNAETGEALKPRVVKVSELDIPNYCKHVGATGYKFREFVSIDANGNTPKYSLDELNKIIKAPAKQLTEVEKLQQEIAELKELLKGNKSETIEEENEEYLEDLRNQYEELYGKKPDGRMKAESLIKKIEEKQ